MGVTTADPLLERDRELAVIQAAVRSASGGEGGTVVVEGPAGIGKTRLLQAARTAAAATGLRILHARGAELERDFPYGLVRQLFERAIAGFDEPERRALLSGAAGAVAPLLDLARAPLPPPLGDSSFPVLHGLYWLTANLAERQPLLLAVDDAHWGDPESLRFLSYLARRIEETSTLLAVAARSDEPATDEESLVAIGSTPHAQTVRLRPLSKDAVAQLVAGAFASEPAPEFSAACHRASAGNPFVLRDLLSELQMDGVVPTAAAAEEVSSTTPQAVARMVLLRLMRLPSRAREFAYAMAVLGDEASLRDGAELASLDGDEALDAADALVEVGLLAPGRPLRFVHPLTRAAIYADLPAARRSRAHRAAARLLASRAADPDAVAIHVMASDPAGDPQTVEMLRAAAARALERGVPTAAFRYLERALAEPPSSDVRHATMVELMHATSRSAAPLSNALLRHLVVEITSTAEELIRHARELAWLLWGTGQVRDAAELLDKAARAAEQAGDPGLALQLVVQRLSVEQARPQQLRAGIERYRDKVAPDSPAERVWLAVEAWRLMLTGDDAARAADLARRALKDWRLLTEQPTSPIPTQAVMALLAAEDVETALQAVDVILYGAKALGSAPVEAGALGLRAAARLRQGRVSDAATDARVALDVARAHSFVSAMPLFIGWMLEAMVERGELEDATRELELSGLEAIVPDQLAYTPILMSRAWISVGQGKHAEALRDLKEIGRRETRSGTAYFSWNADAAIVLSALGDRTAARRHAEAGVVRARRWGAPGSVGRALRAQGIAVGGAAGIELLTEASELLRGSTAQLERLHVLVDLGAALRRARKRVQAREPLREALELARRHGALALARRAHDELVATGEKLAPLTLIGPRSLTPSERRIAELAATGHTNREIAQTLFLSIKTVESHLRGAYRKLDVTSREQLGEALRGS